MYNVLIISNNALSSSRNNGKTLASLFSGLGNVSLSQLYFRDEIPDVLPECRYFQMFERQVIKSFGRRIGREVSIRQTHVVQSQGSVFRKIFSSLSLLRGYALLKCFRDLIWAYGVSRDKSLCKWVDSVNPDVIFFVAGDSLFSYRIVLKIAQDRKIPIITYFTDDYLIYPQGGILFRLYQNRLRRIAQKLVAQSSSCFAIGESMAEEYKRLFGRDFLWIMNCSSFGSIDASPNLDGSLKISYFGGLHFQRWKALAKLGNIFKALRIRGFQSVLNLYSTSEITAEMRVAFREADIIFKGSVFGDDLLCEVNKSDVLVHVECDDPIVSQNTQLSVSTKIPEYLSSRRLVLGFGPAEVASLKLLKKYHLGLVVDSSLPEQSLETILQKLWDKETFQASLNSASQFLETTLNAVEMRKRMFNAIRVACVGRGGSHENPLGV